MSEPQVNNMEVEEAGLLTSDAGRQDGLPVLQDPNDTPSSGQLGLPPASVLPSAEASAASAGEKSGLLSLPRELVLRIASYLSAEYVFKFLPQVCSFFRTLFSYEVWPHRARSLTGSRASFPVVPRDGFDLPSACMEMEYIITSWKGEERADREQRGGEPAGSPRPPPPLEKLSPPNYFDSVFCVLVLGNGELCYAGLEDGNVDLWDVRKGVTYRMTRHKQPRTHQGWRWVRCLAYCGPLVASGSNDGKVRLWNLGMGGAPVRLIKAGVPVSCMSYQMHVLVAGTYDNKVRIYDTRAARALVKNLCLHSDAVECLAADDNYIVSASRDCSMVVYDRRAGKSLQELKLSHHLCSMHYSDSQVWAGDSWGKLQTFSMSSGVITPVSTFNVGHTSLVTGIHRTPGALYTCSVDRTVKVHLPCGPPRTLCTLDQVVQVKGLSVQAGVLAIATGHRGIQLWRRRE